MADLINVRRLFIRWCNLLSWSILSWSVVAFVGLKWIAILLSCTSSQVEEFILRFHCVQQVQILFRLLKRHRILFPWCPISLTQTILESCISASILRLLLAQRLTIWEIRRKVIVYQVYHTRLRIFHSPRLLLHTSFHHHRLQHNF